MHKPKVGSVGESHSVMNLCSLECAGCLIKEQPCRQQALLMDRALQIYTWTMMP